MKYPFLRALADGKELWIIKKDPLKGEICIAIDGDKVLPDPIIPLGMAYKWVQEVKELDDIEAEEETKKREVTRRRIISYLKKKGIYE